MQTTTSMLAHPHPALAAALSALCLMGGPLLRQDPPGHLVLVVQGNVRALTILHAVAKKSPWAGPPKGLESPFALRVLGDEGKQLARIPLDLSHFDTREDRIDAPDSSECCKLRTSRIALLVNAPMLPTAQVYQFVKGDQVIGAITAARMAELLRGLR